MNAAAIAYYENYSPAGDALVVAICLSFVLLIRLAYVNRTRSFLFFRHMLVCLMAGAAANIGFYAVVRSQGATPVWAACALRLLFHAALYGNLFFYVPYIAETMHLEKRERRRYYIVAAAGWLGLVCFELLGFLLRFGAMIDERNVIQPGFRLFSFGYVFFVGIILFMSFRFRARITKLVLRGVWCNAGVAFLLLLIQERFGLNSLTAASFLFPDYALLYLIHSNPYDLDIGAVNAAGFEDFIRTHRRQRSELLLMSLMLSEFEAGGRDYPSEIHNAIRFFSTFYFKGAVLFRVSGGRMVLAMETAKNPDYEQTVHNILEEFHKVHARYQLDHKILITVTDERIGDGGSNYVGLIEYVEKGLPENSIHRVTGEDVGRYLEQQRIMSALDDIYERQDMNDRRVEVYCQPVLNLRTGRYDTAESLMRLRLGEDELVMPDHFIPLAEEYGYISTLTAIILTKTCRQIRRLLDEGFFVERISVNFSMLDLRKPEFSENVRKIMEESGIPRSKLAIELTESQNEQDFMLVKERIGELRDSGIKFYLDDFGTGYSNFERIMELPFDIIKFDRSLVTASSADPESGTMVSYLARMFGEMDYSVLFEGVESEADEHRCADMSARYLQGNRYSEPIPIERLTEFFDRSAS